jgi:hypothetical protein
MPAQVIHTARGQHGDNPGHQIAQPLDIGREHLEHLRLGDPSPAGPVRLSSRPAPRRAGPRTPLCQTRMRQDEPVNISAQGETGINQT